MTVLVLNSNTMAQTIYKCKKDDGTISYQEKACESHKPSMLESKGITDAESYTNALALQQGQLGNYQVSMLVFNWWKGFKKEINDHFLHFKFTDDSGDTPISLLVDFIVPQVDKTINGSDVRKLLIEKGRVVLPDSIEQKVTPKSMKIDKGFGYYSNFTDKNLIDKKVYPAGEFLHTTQGMIIRSGLMINFTLLSNDLEAENHQMAMAFLSNGINIEKKAHKIAEQSLIDQAFEAYYDNKKKEAVLLFEELTTNEPENFKAWIGYCLSLRDTNRLQSAFIACDQALLLKPNDPDTLNSIVNLFIRARLYKLGLNVAQEMIDLSVKDQIIDTIINLGFYAMLDDELSIASQAFDIVKRENGQHGKVMLDTAILKYKLGDSSTAIEILNQQLGHSKAIDEYIHAQIEAIKSNEKIYPKFSNEQPYTNIPKRLQKMGRGFNARLSTDQWVIKSFPVVGVGKLQLEVPEQWFEHVEIRKVNKEQHTLSVKLTDKTMKTVLITINMGRIPEDWTLVDLQKKVQSSLNLLMPDEQFTLKTLGTGRTGFQYANESEVEGVMMFINKHDEFIDMNQINVTATIIKPSEKHIKTAKRIVDSIKIIDAVVFE